MPRWIKAALIVAGIMLADLFTLIGVTRAFLPNKPPMWATAVPFWLLAWPVPLLGRLFPNHNAADRGPSFLAVALSGSIDVAILMALVLWIMRRRSRSAAPVS